MVFISHVRWQQSSLFSPKGLPWWSGLGLQPQCLIGGQSPISWVVSGKMCTFLFVRNQVGGGISRGHILSLDILPTDLTSEDVF